MGSANVGDQSAGRLSRLGEGLDVARMAGTHLDDGYLVLLREAEKGLGHSHVVVEVALCVEHVVLLRQNGGNELLRGGLAVGACDADDGDVELAAVLAGQGFEGLETVVDEDYLIVYS